MSTASVLEFKTELDSAGIDRLVSAMSGAGRRTVMGNVAKEMGVLTRRHIGSVAGSRHKTADRLGATPSGHLLQGESASVVKDDATEETATVEVPIPGIRRAFRPLTIMPRDKQCLTIAIHAMAYNRSVDDLKRDNIPIFRPKGKNILATTDASGNMIPLYALAMSAMIPQDRELLPSDEEYAKTAGDAYVGAIDALRH